MLLCAWCKRSRARARFPWPGSSALNNTVGLGGKPPIPNWCRIVSGHSRYLLFNGHWTFGPFRWLVKFRSLPGPFKTRRFIVQLGHTYLECQAWKSHAVAWPQEKAKVPVVDADSYAQSLAKFGVDNFGKIGGHLVQVCVCVCECVSRGARALLPLFGTDTAHPNKPSPRAFPFHTGGRAGGRACARARAGVCV